MIVILGLDGLEYNYVVEFNCRNLMQKSFGKTDISEFTEPRTVVLWASFLAGENLEKRILSLGEENLWKFRLKPEETFFSNFNKWKAIDVPGFTHKYEAHKKERELLKKFFEKEISVKDYDRIVYKHYNENKREFIEALKKDYDILMGYFSLADSIGHLSFGLKFKMKIIYKELDELAATTRRYAEHLLIISDHGMKPIGRFGDHNEYGFWSLNEKNSLNNPKITSFKELILSYKK